MEELTDKQKIEILHSRLHGASEIVDRLITVIGNHLPYARPELDALLTEWDRYDNEFTEKMKKINNPSKG